MILTYKYSYDHRVSATGLLRKLLTSVHLYLTDLFVRPLSQSHNILLIAGCGHSGTTLLAARFGNLKLVHLEPFETGCFLPTESLRVAKGNFMRSSADCIKAGKSIVVEKTPKHIHCWRRIRRIAPDARLVVVTRNPLDTCASLKARFGDLDFAIARYLIDNTAAVRLAGRKNVHFVRYEDFVNDPRHCGQRLLSELGLDWEEAFAVGNTSAYENVQFIERNMLKRQQQVAGSIQPQINSWRKTLSNDEARRVADATAKLATRLGYDVEAMRNSFDEQSTDIECQLA